MVHRQWAGEAEAGGAEADGAGPGSWPEAGRVLRRHQKLRHFGGRAAAGDRGLQGESTNGDDTGIDDTLV